jgi:uncharacterized protein (DUF924 family)
MSKEDVLAFWYGTPATNAEELRAKMRFWFQAGPAVDAEICRRFLPEIEQALAGELDHWAETTEGRLALVLLLDQLTRSAYRNDPRTWSGDPRAQRLALEALDRGLNEQLGTLGRLFLVMPLSHAEDLALQERSVLEARRLVEHAETWMKPVLSMGIEQTAKYRDVIARFGRFPHRNAVLGRVSTPEELAFLAQWVQAPKAMAGGSPTS